MPKSFFSINRNLFILVMTQNWCQCSQIVRKYLITLFWNKKSRKKIFFENFHFFGTFFEGRATFKGIKHVTRRRAKVESGIKLFLRPRASILAIIDIYGWKRWHLVAKILKKTQITTPPSGRNFSKNLFGTTSPTYGPYHAEMKWGFKEGTCRPFMWF